MALTGRERQKMFRLRNPDWKTRGNGAWQRYAQSKKGKITLLLNYAKDRSIKGNLEYTLDREWLDKRLETGVCEITGLPFEFVQPGNYRTHPFTPSIDRIIPKLGYTKENCRLVCFAVNRALSDWGDGVLNKIAQAIVAKKVMTK